MRRTHKAGVILGLGMLFSAPSASLGQAPGRTTVVTTPHFAFYSDFDTNLNDALIAAGVARKGGKPGYTPMLYGIFDRGAWGGYRKPLESTWRPYVDGERSLSEAAASLIEALRTDASEGKRQ